MKSNRSKQLFPDLRLAILYTVFVLVSLYFAPFVRDFLSHHRLLQNSISALYGGLALLLILLFLYKYRIVHFRAYVYFLALFVFFLYEFFRTPFLVERMHFLEYALLCAVWFRVFRHFWPGAIGYGAAFWFAGGIGVLDECIQDILPNRYFDWHDIYLNVLGAFFGIASVAILMRYRRDKLPRAADEPISTPADTKSD